MDMKKRLFAANAATVIIPLIITLVLAYSYLVLQGRFAESDLSFERYQRLSQIKYETINEQHHILRENPQIVENEEFQEELNRKLQPLDGELVILQNDKIVYATGNFSKIDVEKLLGVQNTIGGSEQVVLDEIPYIVQFIEINDNTGSATKIVLLAPINHATTNLMRFLLFLAATFIVSFLITNIFISYQLSRSIVNPLRQLQLAAGEISKGNLENEISEEGDQEIRELCRDLEVMRIKLKELIHTQLKYEDNRRMLVSSISHDLKTPVTSIKGYVEGIRDGIARTPEKMDKYINTIYLKTEQVDHLINDLLLYAKLDMKQIPFNMERVEITDYIQRCLAESEPEFERYGIQINCNNELKHKQVILFDQDRMKRVIMNILDNSRKYMNKELGRIDVMIRETQTSIILEFRDNGAGIKEEQLPYIFDRFYRSDEARTEIRGSGLGLAIAKQIVEGHQGKIWALSHQGEGTSILISLSK